MSDLKNCYHLFRHRFYKLCGITRVKTNRYGVKLYNKVGSDLFPELFSRREEIAPEEVFLGFDGLKDEYTLLDVPMAQSPHFDMIDKIAKGEDISSCDYMLREYRGTLDGRFGADVLPKSHVNACRKAEEKLAAGETEPPVLYRLNGRLYVYDGKHRLALALQKKMKIECFVIDAAHIAKQSYVAMMFKKMKNRAGYLQNSAHIKSLLSLIEGKIRVLVVNRNRTENLGDYAIAQSMVKLFTDRGAVADLAELSDVNGKRFVKTDYSGSSRQSKPRLSSLKRNRLIRAVGLRVINNSLYQLLRSSKYDKVIIGGGELLQSNGVFPSALDSWTRVSRRRQPSAKIILFAVGATSVFTPKDKKKTARALGRADRVYVRDIASQNNLAEVFGVGSELICDVVFYSGSGRESSASNRTRILYGITSFKRVKRYGMLSDAEESYFELCRKEIEGLIEQFPSAQPALFYTITDDYRACVDFNKAMQERFRVSYPIADTAVPEKLRAAYDEAVCVASPRMHGCILAINSGVPKVIPIIISPKMEAFGSVYSDGFSPEKLRRMLVDAADEVLGL